MAYSPGDRRLRALAAAVDEDATEGGGEAAAAAALSSLAAVATSQASSSADPYDANYGQWAPDPSTPSNSTPSNSRRKRAAPPSPYHPVPGGSGLSSSAPSQYPVASPPSTAGVPSAQTPEEGKEQQEKEEGPAKKKRKYVKKSPFWKEKAKRAAAAAGSAAKSGKKGGGAAKTPSPKRNNSTRSTAASKKEASAAAYASPGRKKKETSGAKSIASIGSAKKKSGSGSGGGGSSGRSSRPAPTNMSLTDVVIRRGRTRSDVRSRKPSKKMLEAQERDGDVKLESPAPRPSAAKSARKAPSANGAGGTKKVTVTSPTEEEEEAKPGKRKYVKKAAYWADRSGVKSPSAKAKAKREADAAAAAAAAAASTPSKKKGTAGKEPTPTPRKPRRYVKKSPFWDRKSSKASTTGGGASTTTASSSATKGRGTSARKPGSKKDTATNEEELSSSESSVNVDAIVCCICRCCVDYGDPDSFLPDPEVLKDKEEESDSSDSESESDEDGDGDGKDGKNEKNEKSKGKKNAEDKKEDDDESEARAKGCNKEKVDGESDDEDSEDEEPFHPPLPHSLHDPHNALLLCDGPGCSRSYHQRCHFVPVLNVPRGEWLCLICKLKEDTVGPPASSGSKGKEGRKRPRKQAKRRSSWDSSVVSSAVSSDDGGGADAHGDKLQAAMTLSELGSLYRVDLPQKEDGNGASAELKVDEEHEEHQKQLQESFELIAAPLKARLLHTELSSKVKYIIDQALSRIRRSENTIRAYTETSRARKSILDRYAQDGQVAQELVQALGRMAAAKLKVRGVLRSLEYIVKTDKSWEVDWLLDWIKTKEARSLTESEQNSSSLMSSSRPLRALLFATGLEKRRVDPRFESLGDVSLLLPTEGTETLSAGITEESEDGGEEKKTDHLPVNSVAVKTASKHGGHCRHGSEEDVSIDNLTCVQCHLATSSNDNDLLLCDGAGCFRAFHQKCIYPNVPEEELEEDVDWFCPYCSALAKWVHYAQIEYLGDEWIDHERKKAQRAKAKAKARKQRERRHIHSSDAEVEDEDDEESDVSSIQSWDHPSDVFPEADEEGRVAARQRRGGKRNTRTDRWLCDLLGIPFGDEEATGQQDGGQDVDDYDEDDDSTVTSLDSNGSDKEESEEDEASDSGVAVEWKIAKSELNALSDYSSSDESSEDDQSLSSNRATRKVRTSKRLRNQSTGHAAMSSSRQARRSNSGKDHPTTALAALLRRSNYPGTGGETTSDSEEEDKPDVGTLDESNIVVGKRNRTKVDYRRLNDAMFGEVDDSAAEKMFGKEQDEYNWAKEMSKKKGKGGTSSSSDEGSSSDEESDDSSDSSDAESENGESDERSKKKNTKPVSKQKTKSIAKKGNRLASKSKGNADNDEETPKKRKYVKKSSYWHQETRKRSSSSTAERKKAAATKKAPSSSTKKDPPSSHKKRAAAKSNDAESESPSKKRKYTKKSSFWDKRSKTKNSPSSESPDTPEESECNCS